MMERNNDIFFAGDYALGYLDGPLHEKYSTTFIWRHEFSRCVSYDQFFDYLHIPLRHKCTHLEYLRLLCMLSHGFDTPFPVLTLLVCHNFLEDCFFLRNSEIYDSP